MSRFRPEEYRSDGGFSVLGLPVLLVALCAAGVGLGWVASFIGQWFYLILLFPLGIGVGLIAVGVFVGRLTKMRSAALAVLLGLLSAGAAIGSMHYFNYLRFLGERAKLVEMMPFLDKLPGGEDAPLLKKVQQADTFLRYLDVEATEGVSIGRGGSDGFNLGYTGTWIYWSVELLAVAVLATPGLIAGAAAPFCSACNEWKEERQLGTLQRKGVDVAAYLREGDLDRLKEHDPAPEGGDLVLAAAVCPGCNGTSPVTLTLRQVTKNDKGEEAKQDLACLDYPGEALPELEAMFAGPKSEAPQ